MSLARRAPKRPADIELERDDHIITDFFGRSSGEEAAHVTGSTAANSDVTVSEESDSDTEAEGKCANLTAMVKL
jgi:hypothetical protein